MDITPLIPKGRNIINSYGDSGFKISEKDFSGSVILLPNSVKEISFEQKDFAEEEKLLSFLSEFADNEIEILLIGTGKNHLHLKTNLREKIKEKFSFASIDEMTTGAACRTFNILTLEDRKVAAILIASFEKGGVTP
jgi:hypothetical protein